jgi:hypothetical protein
MNAERVLARTPMNDTGPNPGPRQSREVVALERAKARGYVAPRRPDWIHKNSKAAKP